jgi:hypothetical protein
LDGGCYIKLTDTPTETEHTNQHGKGDVGDKIEGMTERATPESSQERKESLFSTGKHLKQRYGGNRESKKP